MEDLETPATRVEVLVEESHHPDDLALLPADYRGPELVAIAHAGRLATVTAAGRNAVSLPASDAKSIVEAALAARGDRVEPGIDTALDRVLTAIHVRYSDPRGQAGSFSIVGVVNHAAPHSLPPAWSRLLTRMRDAAGPLSEVDNEAWDRALTWVAPSSLGDVWDAGGVVELTTIVTAIECAGAVYLRVGQPPRRSVLYRMTDAGVLHAIGDDGRAQEVAPMAPAYVRRWRLPCGGGTVMFHHEWRQSARLVIRVDDRERGIYVQRGT